MSEIKLNPIIKGLVPGLTEIGKIKIGIKGGWIKSSQGNSFQPPKKLDHFLVTTLERGEDNNFFKDQAIHKIIGDKPKTIPIVLMFDDIAQNFQCRYACYNGTKVFCMGDGENAIREDKPQSCPCEHLERDYKGSHKCKFNGVLSLIIRGAERVGGCWKFRTTSRNTVQGLYSSLVLIKNITRGALAGIPLNLILNPKASTSPDGKAQTIYVAGIEYPHAPEMLQAEGLKRLEAGVQYGKRLELMAKEADRIISEKITEEDAQEFIEEFYPEEAEGAGTTGTLLRKPETAATPETPPPVKRGPKPGSRRSKTPATPPPEQEPVQTEAPATEEAPERRLSNPDENGYVTDLDTGEVFDGHMNLVGNLDEDGYFSSVDGDQSEPDDDEPNHHAELDDKQTTLGRVWD